MVAGSLLQVIMRLLWQCWYISAFADNYLNYAHNRLLENGVANLLSCWTGSSKDISQLLSQVHDPVWVAVSISLLDIDPEL